MIWRQAVATWWCLRPGEPLLAPFTSFSDSKKVAGMAHTERELAAALRRRAACQLGVHSSFAT
jgi:hypothetical protein